MNCHAENPPPFRRGECQPKDWKYPNIKEEGVPEEENLLKEVFRDGKLLIDQKFSEIRERAS